MTSARSIARASIVLMLAMSSRAFAQSAGDWTLTTSDFVQQQVSVRSIDAGGMTLADSSGTRVPMDRVLDLTRPTVSSVKAGRFALHLSDGDRITGEPVSLVDDLLRWKSAVVGEVKVALRDVLSIGPVDEGRGIVRATGTEDVVHLTNGDTVRGVLGAIDIGGATVTVNGDSVRVPLASVARIDLAQTGPRQTSATGQSRFRVRLLDGSQMTTPAPTGDKDALTIVFAGVSRTLKASDVVSIEQLDGPVSWLAARTPVEQVQTPHLPGREWPARFDRAVDGSRIRFGPRTFAHGIGVHAYSRLSFTLDGSYKTFRTQLAIARDAPYADVHVRILLDGKVAHESLNFRAGVMSDVVRVDVSAGKLLTLEVDYGAGSDVQDRFNWIEPALVR